jgi:hypothetical protein
MDDGTIFEYEGNRFLLTLTQDTDHGAPWDNEDGHGPVSDWTTRAKAPGEMVLCEYRRSRRYYDFAAAVRLARRDGWNAAPYYPPGEETLGQRAHKAALADFDRLRRWCSDDWCYVGAKVELVDEDDEPMPDFSEALWGIESDAGDYFTEVAHELAWSIIQELRARAA